MNVRLLTQAGMIGALLLLIAALQSGRGGSITARYQAGDAGGQAGHLVETISLSPEEYDALPAMKPVSMEGLSHQPNSLDQGGCQQAGGISRVESESFEGRTWPPRGGSWSVSDLNGPRPGFLDDVMWGQVSCEASLGQNALWALGAGRIGVTLDCEGPDKEYFTEVRNDKGLRTIARYGPLNLQNFTGVRVTLDYLAKMPQGALLIGVADGTARERSQTVTYTGYTYFTPDTGGDWVRGEVVNYANGNEFDTILAGFETKEAVEVGFFYRDPATPENEGAPTAGMYGAFMDNIHIDVKTVPRPCPIGSPTPTNPPPSDTPTPEDTPSPTPTPRPTDSVIPTVPPTEPPRAALLPLLVKRISFDNIDDFIHPPTAPTPTASLTPTPSNTPPPSATPTKPPSSTPTEPPTPTNTPRPSPTEPKIPDVVISFIRFISPGGVNLEVAEVFNRGTGPQPMDGWRLFADEKNGTCYFPADLILQPQEAYEIRTGRDATEGVRENEQGEMIDGSICRPLSGGRGDPVTSYIWDDNIDRGILFDDFGGIVHKYCYDLEGVYPCFR